MQLDAHPAELLCDVGLDRLRGGDISGTGGVSIFLPREPTTVAGVGLIRDKAESCIVVGYGLGEAAADVRQRGRGLRSIENGVRQTGCSKMCWEIPGRHRPGPIRSADQEGPRDKDVRAGGV